jgi:hypothetical protein
MERVEIGDARNTITSLSITKCFSGNLNAAERSAGSDWPSHDRRG